jgi:hypothetical protein
MEGESICSNLNEIYGVVGLDNSQAKEDVIESRVQRYTKLQSLVSSRTRWGELLTVGAVYDRPFVALEWVEPRGHRPRLQ